MVCTGVWGLIAFALSSLYNCNLRADLMQIDYTPPIHTLEDVRNHVKEIYYFAYNFDYDGGTRDRMMEILGPQYTGKVRTELSNVMKEEQKLIHEIKGTHLTYAYSFR